MSPRTRPVENDAARPPARPEAGAIPDSRQARNAGLGTVASPGTVTGLGNIAAPGKLQEENRDSAITGGTRSLSRRVLGLDVLKPAPVSASKRKPMARPGAKPAKT